MTKTCRSELARDELKGAAFILNARVIVNVLRERARSYKGQVSAWQRDPHGLGFEQVIELLGAQVLAEP